MDHSGKRFAFAVEIITSTTDYFKVMVEFTDNCYITMDFKELVWV